METRISSVEVARFMAAMMVALGHFTFLANEGSSFLHFAYVAVEFFLMLSGFFMMCEVTKNRRLERQFHPVMHCFMHFERWLKFGESMWLP